MLVALVWNGFPRLCRSHLNILAVKQMLCHSGHVIPLCQCLRNYWEHTHCSKSCSDESNSKWKPTLLCQWNRKESSKAFNQPSTSTPAMYVHWGRHTTHSSKTVQEHCTFSSLSIWMLSELKYILSLTRNTLQHDFIQYSLLVGQNIKWFALGHVSS